MLVEWSSVDENLEMVCALAVQCMQVRVPVGVSFLANLFPPAFPPLLFLLFSPLGVSKHDQYG